MKQFRFTVDTHDRYRRLDSFVTSASGLTRAHIQKLIQQGLVLVNSEKKRSNYRVKNADEIELTIPPETVETVIPENIPLEVIWEDDVLIVINKPPNMVVHPSAGHRSGTLINALAARCERLSSIGSPLRPGVVHRIDKNTSGLIVVAKDDSAYHDLQKQFKEREVEKYYLALLNGSLGKERGEIRKAIGRSISERKKMSTRTRKGKEAVTRFEVVKRMKPATLVKIRLVTGRTHQIRVHCASLGHPVLGDTTYGKKTSLKLSRGMIRFHRQMLHAMSLRFRHPVQGISMEFTAPLPEDMKQALKELSE
jgi:23S rRNA pseudouridine1911/1915/1917 synthase